MTRPWRPRWKRILSAVPPERRRWALVALIGWWLSPLTAWNDAFTNIPLAIGTVYLLRAMGWEVEPKGAAVVAYILTNLVGLGMLSIGVGKISLARPGSPRPGWLLRAALRVAVYIALSVLVVWSIEKMLGEQKELLGG